MLAFHGTIVDPGDEAGQLTVCENAWLVIDSSTGIIVDFSINEAPESASSTSTCTIRHLHPHEILCPGFIDTHVHAAQIQYQGTGTDLPLMEWLEKYAFPSEKRLTNDLSLSRNVYEKLGTNSLSLFVCLMTHISCFLFTDV